MNCAKSLFSRITNVRLRDVLILSLLCFLPPTTRVWCLFLTISGFLFHPNPQSRACSQVPNLNFKPWSSLRLKLRLGDSMQSLGCLFILLNHNAEIAKRNQTGNARRGVNGGESDERSLSRRYCSAIGFSSYSP